MSIAINKLKNKNTRPAMPQKIITLFDNVEDRKKGLALNLKYNFNSYAVIMNSICTPVLKKNTFCFENYTLAINSFW
ncbi:hypothetical protein B0B39_18195 [Legionella longbeachae]|nr:hypothetical protein B0B39_18195 [Legionella longbeachae]